MHELNKDELVLILSRISYGYTVTPAGKEWIVREKDLPSYCQSEILPKEEKTLVESKPKNEKENVKG